MLKQLRASPPTALRRPDASRLGGRLRLLTRPAAVFSLLSLGFGSLAAILNPPLHGPDEMAHVLRAYGIAQGEIVPATALHGRQGLFISADLHDAVQLFDDARPRDGKPGPGLRQLMAEHRDRAGRPTEDLQRPPVFVPYQGSEGYTPAAYLPYVAAALVARLGGLDFVATLYLMRFAGLVATTAITAHAIALAPHLGWAFLLIAMLPASLYGRSIVGADGAVLSCTMLALALCLNAARSQTVGRPWRRSAWLTLSVLCKPSQLVFVLLEPMAHPVGRWLRRWRVMALVMMPGLILSLLWVAAISGEMAAWRIIEGTGLPAEQFDPAWKLSFMAEHPGHFPAVLLNSLVETGPEAWRQLIGVLGWLDTPLRPWVYPMLSGLLIAVLFGRLDLDLGTRRRLVLIAGVVAVAYVATVHLILFLTWTPTEASVVWGVQGRYFVVVLPLAAILFSALTNRGLPGPLVPLAASAGALIAGAATVEALLRAYPLP